MIEHGDKRLHLCVVTDDLRHGPSELVSRCESAARGGASMVLLRLKHADARIMVEVGRLLVATLTIPVIVSERLDVALACGAAGVHLTSRSMPVMALRAHVGADFLIGGSVSAAEDLEAAAPADYVTIGPVFDETPQAMGISGFVRLARASGRPAVAIGGIDRNTVSDIRAAGAAGVAVIRAILAADDPTAAANALV